MIDAHARSSADITIAAQPVPADDAPEMGIFLFDREGQIVGFEEKPRPDRLAQIGSSLPEGASFTTPIEGKPFIASMGIYVFSHDVLFDILNRHPYVDFGKEVIPKALGTHKVRPYLYCGFWADVGTIDAFYEANIQLTRPRPDFRFYDPERPIYSQAQFLPGSHFAGCHIERAIVADGCALDDCHVTDSVVGLRTRIDRRARVSRSVLLGADFYEGEPRAGRGHQVPMGIGRDAVLDGVIVDKNARIGRGVRLVNERGIEHIDGDGYYIRNRIIIVPKGAVVAEGTVV
jgi:glucose-1-phosphate adenylyltransferase